MTTVVMTIVITRHKMAETVIIMSLLVTKGVVCSLPHLHTSGGSMNK